MNKEESSTKKGRENENIAIIIGFSLIVLVIIFTLLRSTLLSESDNANPEDKQLLGQASASAYTAISAMDLNKKILTAKNKNEITLLDIRPFGDYISEHIIDAINIPLDEFPIASKVDTHSVIIIIGKNSNDEDIKTAVEKLKEEKIENMKVLAGGMDSWKQIIGSSVTFGDPKSFIDQSKVAYLNPEELNNAFIQKVPVYIVDVRTADEYAKGHITGAINIPFEELEKRRSEIKERKIIVVGANELQEFQASVQLYDMLLVSPFVMKGAMPAWESKGFPLVTN